MTEAMDRQTPQPVTGFQVWRDVDGTKEGLENLLESLSQI
jgi:hypothetical protein